jgi:pyruvate/2-oxoglutarate dehydrogenase complex dihydrolipoamide acyltransferase (E2) component
MKKVTFDILIPRISDEIIDCQIARWLKDVDDYIYEGDIIVELETEKTTIEIESPTDGILEGIYVFEGEEVIEGERIGIINTDESWTDDEDVLSGNDTDDELEYAPGSANDDNDEMMMDEIDDLDEENIRTSVSVVDVDDDTG